MNQLVTCQIVGNSDQKGWSQIHHLVPSRKNLCWGEAIILISTPLTDEDGLNLGREIILRFYEEYYSSQPQSKLKRLKDILIKISQEKLVYLENQNPKLDIVVGIFYQQFVWLATLGKGEILLFRNGQLLPIIKGAENLVKVASGIIQPKDLLVIGSQEFFKTIPQLTIAGCLKTANFDQIKEIISPLVYSQPKQGRLAVAIIASKLKIDQATVQPTTLRGEKSPTSAGKNLKAFYQSVFFKTKIKNWFLSLIAFSQKILKRFFSFPRQIRIRPQFLSSTTLTPQTSLGQNRSLTFAGLAFLTLLCLSILLSWQKKKNQDRQKFVQEKIHQSQETLKNAWAIRELDLDKSLTLAKQAQQNIQEGLKVNPNQPTLKQLLNQANHLIDLSGGGERISPTLFFDLKIIADNVSGSCLRLKQDNLWILDPQGQRLIKLGIDNKKTAIVAGGEALKNQKKIIITDKNVYFFSEEGIKKLKKENQLELVIKNEWLKPIAFSSWGENLYLVDRQGKKIFKYVPQEPGFAKPISWLTTAPPIEWEKIVDLAIDGSLWLLNQEGRVLKFTAGSQEDIKTPDFKAEAEFLTVAQKAPFLAFWDTKEKTVLVLKKNGQIVAKIPLGLEAINGLALIDDGKKIFILTGDKIYNLELNFSP